VVWRGVAPPVFCALALIAFACFDARPAFGQIPGVTPAARPAAKADAPAAAPETIEQRRARLLAQLDEVRADRERLGAEAPAAADIAAEDLSVARNTLAQLTLAIEGQLRTLDDQQSVRAARQQAEKLGAEWKAFPDPPPYSQLLVDSLRESVDSIRTTVSALTAQRVIAEQEKERALAQAQRSEAALRRAREALALARDEGQRAAQAKVQIAEWNSAAAAASLAMFQLGIELVDEQTALEQERLRLAERQLTLASSQARFSDADLEQVRRGEAQRADRLRASRLKAGEVSARQDRELAAASDALRRLEADPKATADALLVARARVRAAQAAADAARFEVETLDNLVAASAVVSDLYALRFQALNDGSAARRREATVRLRDAVARFKPWRDYAQSQLELLRAVGRESGLRADGQQMPPQVQVYDAAAADALRQRIGNAQRLLDTAERAERTLTRWVGEIEAAQDERPPGERLANAWAVASDWGQRVWNFELFAVEDTIDVAGQRITTSRGVTIGKSVGALLLFVIGYWVASRLARRFERLLVGRFGLKPAQARTVRRWALTLAGFVLLVLTLNLARIPLTVFAFLGGALAIGVGFGTQTIIRNFISGLIVLMERQVQVGDTIEVDGVTGTVEEVNLRSSTVRAFDGVEAIIPNSSLLENRVTNWTKSDLRIRRVVKVGVAYGSPVRKVSDLLLDCLDRHGLVLKEPEPVVLFEDFGDSALVFGMYFWLEMKPGVVSTVVMSDLRFMVHKALEEAGIAVPFPQRDVHLDASRPLQVQIAGPAPTG
jgi:small-conductance mechanosensitive channel